MNTNAQYWITRGLESGCYVILGLSMDGHRYIVFLSYFARGSWAWLLCHPWTVHGWSWIHCIPELLCHRVWSLATMTSLDCPWRVVDTLYSWVTLPRGLEPGYYAILGLSMDGRGYIVFLSYFARGSWAWLLCHPWTVHGWSWIHCIPELLCQGVLSLALLRHPWSVRGWSWIHCIPELLCQGVLSLATMLSLDCPWMVEDTLYSWVTLPGGLEPGFATPSLVCPWMVMDTLYSWVTLPGGLEPGYYAILGLSMDGRGYIVFLSYFARGSWAWLLCHPWTVHGWSWIHCIPELLCQGVLSLATMPSLDCPWMVVDTLYSWVTLPGGLEPGFATPSVDCPWMVVDTLYSWVTLPGDLEPGYYAILGLSMDGHGYIVFLSYFARGSWAWLLCHPWTVHGWSWIHCIPELLCQGVLSLATMPSLDCPWMVMDTLYSWVTLPGGLEPGYYAILGLSMDGRGYIVFLSYFARGSWAWLLCHPWTVHGWSWIHCIPELLCQGVLSLALLRHPWTVHGWSWIHCIPGLLCQGILSLATMPSLDCPWMVMDTLYSWVTLPGGLEPGYYAILGLSMDGHGYIVFLSYFARGSWAWLLCHPWTVHGWSWIHCIPELLCQGVLSLATMPSLDCPWMVVDTLYSWVTLPGGLEPGYYAILELSMDGRGYIVFLSYFARGSWAWLLCHPWTVHGWSWIHCIPELLCQGVLSLAAMTSLDYPWMVIDTLYSWVTLPGGLEPGCYDILGLSMDGRGYIVFLSYFARGSWAWLCYAILGLSVDGHGYIVFLGYFATGSGAWLLCYPWTVHGWSWIHCISELLCHGVLSLATMPSLDCPWMVVDTLYFWVTLPRGLEPGYYAILGLSMDGHGYIVFLSYFARGSWAWLLCHPWTVHGWSWIHCIPELLCQGVLSLATMPSLDCPWMVVDTLYSWVALPGGLEPGYYAILGLFMDGRGYIVFLSYFARGSWAWLLWHPWTIHGWS